jgi:hypothetical protein
MERTAECHCRSLKVTVAGEPERIYLCHCKACQRRTGAIVHSGATYLNSQVRIEGEHRVYARMADSGYEIRFHFCPNCGSNVFFEGDKLPHLYGIMVGCFADPSFPLPTYSHFEEDKHGWLGLPAGIDHFKQSRGY